MAQDYNELKKDLGSFLGATKSPTQPVDHVDTFHQTLLDDLNGASDADFDKRYISQQQIAFSEAATLFKNHRDNGDNPGLQNLCKIGLPILEKHASTAMIDLGARILAGNDAIASRNRAWFSAPGIVALNLMSGPGAGKTTLLERTLREFRSVAPIVVIEGDQATDNDAARIRAAGGRWVQINTGKGCHLDAAMVQRGLAEVNPPNGVLLMMENVGNLVCPSLFDLGEEARIALLSATEGDDKPLKYPHMFAGADLLLLNKIDLCPYVDFDVDKAVDAALRVNPRICVLRISAKTGEGMQSWFDWLNQKQNG